jgi:2-oxoisovalerate dehydrogenase E1 component alpha subunit
MRKNQVSKKTQKAPPGKALVANQGSKSAAKGVTISNKLTLPKALQLNMLDLMIKSRVLEERLIKVYKTGDSFFWIGGPGEEAFGVSLGLLINKGHGVEHDFLHLHYRASPTLVAMGMSMVDALRLTMNRATDRSTGGRNFCGHYCYPEWNVTPITSPLTVQYGFAIGTAIAQRRRRPQGNRAISIITGGDAASAEGDFASSLIWASRPGNELPMFITIQNNRWGISTSYDTQHGEKFVSDRAKAFGIRTAVINGNDPVESYLAIQSEMDYIRRTGKPVCAQFEVSRLFGHSSADGANRRNEHDPLPAFEKRAVDQKIASSADIKALWEKYEAESVQAAETARAEAGPGRETIWDHVYVDNENADWRKF